MQISLQLDWRVSGANIPPDVSAGPQDVSLPRDMLNTLLNSINDLKSSVNTLQESVSKLQSENQGLREELKSTKTDLLILRENSGVKFPQFMRPPVELRRQHDLAICMHSPSNTQYQRSRGSRSRVIIVMNACTETKSVGLALKLDYFLVGPQTSYPSPEVFSTIKNYVNLDVDTVSMTRDTEYMAFPEYIPWICGKCNVNDKCDADPCCVGCNSAAGDNAPGAVRCVAVDFMRWMGPDDEQLEMGTWEICQSHGVKEILLVVGNVGVVEWERDTSWVAPTQSPLLTHLYMTRELKVPENRVKTSHAREKGMVRSMRYWDVRDLFEEHLRALGGVLGLICLNENGGQDMDLNQQLW